MKIERREFLKLFGGAAGVVVAGGFGVDQLIEVPDRIVDQVRRGPGIETWRNTICGMCPGGCGIRVRLVDDVPVYLRGNENFPVNFGGMCPLGHASLEILFHPDRLQGPVRRIGPPGDGRFEPVEWPMAMESIASRLKELRRAGRSHEVAFLGSPDGSLTGEIVRRFMRAYGSPNVFLRPEVSQAGVPYLLTDGHAEPPAYDLLNARTILSLGSHFLEGEFAPVHYTKLFSREPEGNLKTLIHADSRLGLTGAKAQRWLPVRPGTHGALALGIANVLIREDLIDRRFVTDRTVGFDDWTDSAGNRQRGFRSMVLEEYFPERVSEITGVPSEAILNVARMVGIDIPSVVIGGSSVADDPAGTFGQMAVHSLNALLGNFGSDGGVMRAGPTPLAALPPLVLDAVAESGLQRPTVGGSGSLPLGGFSVDAFTENVLAGRPYPLQVLFLMGGNPVFESIRHHDFVEALRRIPLVVSFDSLLNETSEFAGFVLPDHTFLESWDVVSGVPSVGTAHVGIRRPVIDPLYDTRQAARVIGELAHAIGPTMASAFPFAEPESAVRHQARGLYEAGYGAVSAEGVSESWLEYLLQRGWHLGQYDSFDTFWVELLRHGGWWNPVRDRAADRRFTTSSGRFEFFSQTLLAAVVGSGTRAPTSSVVDGRLAALGISARGSEAFMPHVELDAGPDDPSLHLVTFVVPASRGYQGASLPLMQELFGMGAHRPWRTWMEIHPRTAAERGISDGDRVQLSSSIGSILVQAKVVPSISPECVGVPFGLGHTSFGRFARGVGVNPHAIIRARYDPISGRPAVLATRVILSSST